MNTDENSMKRVNLTKYILNCSKCGAEEERNSIREITCFSCKKKRMKEWYLDKKKKKQSDKKLLTV